MNLILTSWAVGIFVSGIVLRNGLGAESMAWSIMFLLLPLTCVYYPVAVLPALAAGVRLGAAADLRVRGHAGAADRPRLPRRPDAAGASRSTPSYFAGGRDCLPAAAQSARRDGSLLQARRMSQCRYSAVGENL